MNSAGALTASTACTTPSPFRWKTAKLTRSRGSPRTTISAASNGRPAICSLRSYWSDQNHGTSGAGGGRPHDRRPPASPAPARSARSPGGTCGRTAASAAACSRRSHRWPDPRCGRRRSTTMPSSQASPAARASSSFGTAPTPTSTASHAMTVGRPSAAPPATRPSAPSNASTAASSMMSHAGFGVTALEEIRQRRRRRRGPAPAPRARSPRPRRRALRADAATSRPI